MCLLDLVEEDDLVGTAAHGLGELPSLIIAHVAGRGTEKAADRVTFTVLAHVYPQQRFLIFKQEPRQGLGQLGLAHPAGTQEQEPSRRAPGIFQARASPSDRIGHRLDGLTLANDALVQYLLHVQQLFGLSLHHIA